MKTTIQGMGCNVELTGTYGRNRPAITNRDPDDCHEAENIEIDFEVQSLKGRPNPWLRSKMTDDDIARIEEELTESHNGF